MTSTATAYFLLTAFLNAFGSASHGWWRKKDGAITTLIFIASFLCLYKIVGAELDLNAMNFMTFIDGLMEAMWFHTLGIHELGIDLMSKYNEMLIQSIMILVFFTISVFGGYSTGTLIRREPLAAKH
ncbi:hypothetical protein HON52_02040 [Candidatus Uhrbacteria bacterium]|nr:hypothetical protein [Candidatus Uhrbacteria bacterium]